MHSIILSAFMLDTFGRVAAILIGLLLMLGSLWSYRKMGVDGVIASWCAGAGFLLILCGIGGDAILNAMSH